MNEVYNQILKAVCDYLQVQRYDVLMNKTNAKGKQNQARTLAVYLIRKFTEDKFLAIGLFFDTPASNVGAQYLRVLDKVHSKKPCYREYNNLVSELEELVSEKLNLVVTS